MKIAIVGAGAMGSVYGGLLAEAGHELWMVDGWQAHIEAIRAHGLQLSGASGDRVIEGLNATTDIAQAGHCDLYVIATKADGVGAEVERHELLRDDPGHDAPADREHRDEPEHPEQREPAGGLAGDGLA